MQASPLSLSQRLLRSLLTLTLLAAMFSVFTITTAAPSFAGDDACESCDGNVGTDTDTSGTGFPPPDGGDNGGGGGSGNGDGDGNGGNGGGGGGGGGQLPAGSFAFSDLGFRPARPPSPIGGGSHSLPGVVWTDDSNTFRYNNLCQGNYTWTDKLGVSRSAPYAGWKWSIYGVRVQPFTDPEGYEVPEKYHTSTGGYSCLNPPTYTIYPVWCPIATRAVFEGPYKNPVRPANEGGVKFGPDQTRFAAQGKNSRELCEQSYVKDYNKSGLQAWGQYKLTASARIQKCEYTVYQTADPRTGRKPDPELSCPSNSQKMWVNKSTDYLELMCSATTEYAMHEEWHNNHSFTTEDCRRGGGGTPRPSTTWDCGPWPVSRFNGRVGDEFEVLDDGKKRSLKWTTPTPGPRAYLKDLEDKTTHLRLGDQDRISPYRAGAGPNANTQPFIVTPGVDEWNRGWNGTSDDSDFTGWDLQFMAPGVLGKPWTVTPQWAFTGQFLTWVPAAWEFDLEAGTVKVTRWEAEWYTAQATCDGPPVDLNVYRARNSQGRS